VSESHFHHVILAAIGVAGIVWFYAIPNARQLWPQPKRIFIGMASGLVYVVQVLSAFATLSSVSSLGLFGFVGCVLGCLGAARAMGNASITFRSSAIIHGA
jgi:hypothetical protein